MDTNVLITLLTIAVILLSVVIIAWLAMVTIVLIRVRRILRQVEAITLNITAATDWLSPAKLIGYVSKLFR